MTLIYKVFISIVLLRDNKWLSIAGVSTIQIKMYDATIRTLKVWHVLKIEDFFLSLFDPQGYDYSTKGEFLRVCKSPHFMVKGYHIQNSTIIDSVGVLFMVTSDNTSTQL